MSMSREQIEAFITDAINGIVPDRTRGGQAVASVVESITNHWEQDRQDARDEKHEPCMGPCCGGRI
jgi:hypothetical protein